MCETSWSLSFWIKSDSNIANVSARFEEFFNSPLFGPETEIANKKGGWFGTITALWLEPTGSLATELNPDVESIEYLLIACF